VFELILGAILLYLGAEGFIYGGARCAALFRIPLSVIGIVIIGYGTGIPEWLVSIKAAYLGYSDIAFGNVVGSNIANIGLVLGLAGLFRPFELKGPHIRLTMHLLLLASSLLFVFYMTSRTFFWFQGLFFFLGFLGFTFMSLRVRGEVDSMTYSRVTKGWAFVFLVFGGVFLFWGSAVFLSGALSIAESLSVSTALVALTLVALGTSLPELVTALVAAFRKKDPFVIGNVIGSCLFNILAIIGSASLMHPLTLNQILLEDMCIFFFFTFWLWVKVQKSAPFSRRDGLFFLSLYLIYMGYLMVVRR